MKKTCLALASSLVLAGCASTAPPIWYEDSPCKEANQCSLSEALQAHSKSGEYCREITNFYENGGHVSTYAKLAIGVTGALAGSVFGVLAGGSAATAWSGLSGAANGAQLELNGSAIGPETRKAQAKRVSEIEADYISTIDSLITDSDGITQKDANTIVALSVSKKNACYGAGLTTD